MNADDTAKPATETTSDAPVTKAAAPTRPPPRPARPPIVHTRDRDPKDREQWKRERAEALGHAPKPTK